MEASINPRFNWLRRCWRRFAFVTVFAIFFTNIHYLITFASGTNIQKMSPTLRHQHHDVINITVAYDEDSLASYENSIIRFEYRWDFRYLCRIFWIYIFQDTKKISSKNTEPLSFHFTQCSMILQFKCVNSSGQIIHTLLGGPTLDSPI